MRHIRNFFHNINDIVLAIIIVALAAGIIYWRMQVIMDYPKELANERAAEAQEQEEQAAEETAPAEDTAPAEETAGDAEESEAQAEESADNSEEAQADQKAEGEGTQQ